ncbi:TPA: hypothetical protein I7159_21795 [Vibrio vulnificus]|nr:hypothetical protein [Vibrio vulnificus]
MKLLNKSFDGLDPNFKGHLSSNPWTLCIGAGVSFSLVPTWYNLTKNVVNDAFGWDCNADDFDDLASKTGWSLDSLLQGASNKLDMDGKPKETFNNLLEQYLYHDLLESVATPLLKTALKKGLSDPRVLNRQEASALLDFFETHHKQSTLNQLTEVLDQARTKERLPLSIINFNADTLLHLLLDVKNMVRNNPDKKSWNLPKSQFMKSFRGVQKSYQNVVPIHHCHGAISPRDNGLKNNKDARHNIVFRENEYLEIAGTATTWAQTLCLYHAQNSHFLIIGHSLSDPNIRKWLAWSHQNHIKELGQFLPEGSSVSPRHIWINVKPQDSKQQELMEISLLHIGVRVCWIESWNDVEKCLNNLLAL